MDSTPALTCPHSEIAPWSIWIFYFRLISTFGATVQLIMRPEPYHANEMKIGPGAPLHQDCPKAGFTHHLRRFPDHGMARPID